jgi:hypothetical protein
MSTIVLKSDSSDNLNLLIALANKLGIEVSVLSDETIEDLGLANAMKSGRTGEYVDTSKFLQSLTK